MKALARSYLWWPDMDQHISNFVKTCDTCQFMQNANPDHSIQWPTADRFFQRVHIDFCKFDNTTLLVLFDVYSKWLEVCVMPNTDADNTIHTLFQIFTIFGLPEQITSDNGPPFTSTKFEEFCSTYKILHTKSPPYHAQSNGSAERAV